MSHEIARHEPTIMEMVQQIVSSSDPHGQVEVLNKLLDAKERMEDREAKKAFYRAKRSVKDKMGPITKDGVIRVKGVIRSRYTTLDKLDEVLTPLMNEFGLDLTVSEAGPIRDGMREFIGKLAHTDGFSDSLLIHLPLDKSEFRTATQSEGSTISYARRQLIKAHFNIIERNQDDDGSGLNVQTITDDQLKDLETKIQDVGANKAKFLEFWEIGKLSDLKQADLDNAMRMLDKSQRVRKR